MPKIDQVRIASDIENDTYAVVGRSVINGHYLTLSTNILLIKDAFRELAILSEAKLSYRRLTLANTGSVKIVAGTQSRWVHPKKYTIFEPKRLAQYRISCTEKLKPYKDVLMDGSQYSERHWNWVCTASAKEITQWAKSVISDVYAMIEALEYDQLVYFLETYCNVPCNGIDQKSRLRKILLDQIEADLFDVALLY